VNSVNVQNKVLVMSLSPQFESSRSPNFYVEVQKNTTFDLDRLLINYQQIIKSKTVKKKFSKIHAL
jgi:hypothetical protein